MIIEVRAVGLSFPGPAAKSRAVPGKGDAAIHHWWRGRGIVVSAPADSGFSVGDRVAGMAPGAAAERTVADPALLMQLSDQLSFAQGAALPLNYRTAILGMEVRGRLQPGETVLIHGAAGGTGTAAIQVALASGCRVIGVVSSDAKEQAARKAGAHEVLRSDGPWKDQALELTGGRGVDMVWDPVGGDRVFDTMRALAPFGRWVVLGFTGEPIPSVALNRILLRNIDVVGTYIGGYIAQFPETRTGADQTDGGVGGAWLCASNRRLVVSARRWCGRAARDRQPRRGRQSRHHAELGVSSEAGSFRG